MKTLPRRLHPRVLYLAALLLGALPSWGQVTISVTAFNAASWGDADATLGITGYTIEDFEDTTLASGLLIGWETPAGNVSPAGTLPNLFNPLSDPFGNAFYSGGSGAWDGSYGLINTRTNESYDYNAAANWGDILITFTTPVTSAGFSVQQNGLPTFLVINGTNFGSLDSLTGLTADGFRYGYLRIDATSGSISTIQLMNARNPPYAYNDGFMLDHLAFQAIPEPSTYAAAAGLLALVAAAWTRRKRTAG